MLQSFRRQVWGSGFLNAHTKDVKLQVTSQVIEGQDSFHDLFLYDAPRNAIAPKI
jgi:hypothetical protein